MKTLGMKVGSLVTFEVVRAPGEKVTIRGRLSDVHEHIGKVSVTYEEGNLVHVVSFMSEHIRSASFQH